MRDFVIRKSAHLPVRAHTGDYGKHKIPSHKNQGWCLRVGTIPGIALSVEL